MNFVYLFFLNFFYLVKFLTIDNKKFNKIIRNKTILSVYYQNILILKFEFLLKPQTNFNQVIQMLVMKNDMRSKFFFNLKLFNK